MYKYIFESLKKNIFLVKFIDINNTFNKTFIVKLSNVDDFNITCIRPIEHVNNIKVCNTDYHYLFEKIIYSKIITKVNFFDDIDIEFEHDDIKYSFSFNLDEMTDLSILKFEHIKPFMNIKNHILIQNMSLIIEEYNEKNNIIIYHLNNILSFDYKMYLLELCMDKIHILHNELNMIHGDCKTNNILYNVAEHRVTFIDLEFSLFIEKDDFIKIENAGLVNNYLCQDNDYYINGNFFRLFDIFIFSLSYFITNSMDKNMVFKQKFEQKIYNELDKKREYSDTFILFFIIYTLIYKFFSEKNMISTIDDKTYYSLCELPSIIYFFHYDKNIFQNYDIITKILFNIDKIMIDLYNKNHA